MTAAIHDDLPQATITRRKWEARAVEVAERDFRLFSDCAMGLDAEDFAQNVFDTLREEGCPEEQAREGVGHFVKLVGI